MLRKAKQINRTETIEKREGDKGYKIKKTHKKTDIHHQKTGDTSTKHKTISIHTNTK